MGADSNTVLARQAHGFDHGHGIAGVKSAGHIGRCDIRHKRCIRAHDPIAKTLAAININVESLSHGGILRVVKRAPHSNNANFRS